MQWVPLLPKTGKHQPYAVLIALIFFLLAFVSSIVTPLFESPDELWHYPFVWHLARGGALPVQDPSDPQLWQQEGSQPPLYYQVAALLTAPIPADDLPALIYPNPHADIGLARPDGNANIIVHTDREKWPWQGAVLAVHLARLFSVVLGTGTVLATYALAHTLWPEHPTFAAVATAFVAFNPMFIFISGSVNNDNLITLLAALTLWLLVRLVLAPGKEAKQQSSASDGLVWWYFAGLGLLTGAAALSKVSGLGLAGLVGLTLLGWGWRRRSWRIAIGGNIVVVVLTVAVAGWWYWRNLQRYGDWTGTNVMIAMMGPRPISPTLDQFVAELSGLVRSFWGVFGYFSVLMPSFIYTLLNVLFLAGIAGLLYALWSRAEADKLPPSLTRVWPILLGWIVVLAAGLVQWTLRTPATQGRLLFPALSALAIFWAAGWTALVPARWQMLPGLGMFLLAAWLPWGVIGPAYARPAPVAELPSSAQPLAVTFGDAIHLLGYKTDATTVQPGNVVSLTLYWQGLDSLETDYTVFVHVLDETDLVVAQRDVFHGPGLYPTSQWQPGQIFGDRYALILPNTTYAPAQARFEVGLVDPNSSARLLTASGGDNVRFGTLEIQPAQPANRPNPQQLHFEDNILLVGYELDQRQATPGDTITLQLYWHSLGIPDQNYKVFVHLVDGDRRAAQHDSEPQNGAAPTGAWVSGQTIIDPHPLTIAPDAPPGAYQLVVGLYDAATGRRLRLFRDGEASVQADSVTLGGVRVVPP